MIDRTLRRYAFATITLLAVFCLCLQAAEAQQNSRNWMFLQQDMTGGGTVTSSIFSAFNSLWPFKTYALSVTNTASGTSFEVRLEGSLDRVTWTPIAITTSATGFVSNENPLPALYLRLRAPTLTSGKAITATAIGVP